MDGSPENEKKFECDQCLESFNRNFSLTLHKTVIHDCAKTLECKETGKIYNIENEEEEIPIIDSFNDEKSIESVHNLTRVHKCDICQMTFSRKRTMKYHVEYIHKQDKMYKCKMCEKAFSTEFRSTMGGLNPRPPDNWTVWCI